ncbi:MAG: hypothetical protein ACOCX5_02850 [Chloroflexota bacterium]
MMTGSDVADDEFVWLYIATAAFQIIMLGAAILALRGRGVNFVQRVNVMLSTFCLSAGTYSLSLADFAF